MEFNLKAISPVVATALLLVVAVVALINFQSFYSTYSSGLLSDTEKKSNVGVIDLEYLASDKLYVKSPSDDNLSYSDIKIDGKSCNLNGTFSKKGLAELDLGFCTQGMEAGYKEVVFVTDTGIFTETLKLATSGITGNLTASFAIGTTSCVGTKILGIEDSTVANNYYHAESPGLNTYSDSLCINHQSITLDNLCSGNYATLFYLGNTTSSHIWLDNSTAYPEPYVGYYNWQEICVSSPTGTVTATQGADPSDGSVCLMGYKGNQTLGATITDCADLTSDGFIWVNIS